MSDPRILDELRRAVRSGKILLNITQCLRGTVDMGHYSASSELLEMGVISGLDMTPEAALAKMFWLLERHRRDRERACAELQISQRGEQSADLYDLRVAGPSKPVVSALLRFHLNARFESSILRRAMFRIHGARFISEPGQHFSFIVQSGRQTASTPVLAEFNGVVTSSPASLVAGITSPLITLPDSRDLEMTLRCNVPFRCSSAQLSLLCEAQLS